MEDLPFFLDEFDLSHAHPAAWARVLEWSHDLARPGALRDEACERMRHFLAEVPGTEDAVQEREMMLPVAARRVGFELKHGTQSVPVRNALVALDTALAKAQDQEDAPSLEASAAMDQIRRDVLASNTWDGKLSYEMFLRQRDAAASAANKKAAWWRRMNRNQAATLVTFLLMCAWSLSLAVALLLAPSSSALASPAFPTSAAVLMFVQATLVTFLSALKPSSIKLADLSSRVVYITAIDIFVGASILSNPEQGASVGSALSQFLVFFLLVTLGADMWE